MDASSAIFNCRALRPVTAAAAAGLLLTGVACNGPQARRAVRPQAPATAVTTVVPAGATAATAPAPPGQAVRTDDLDAGLQQADSQLSQTGSAVGDADQNPQQNSD